MAPLWVLRLQNWWFLAKRGRIVRLLRLCAYALLALFIVDTLYIFWLMPDWAQHRRGEIHKSRFIENYEQHRRDDTELPALHWNPVALTRISPNLVRAVIIAEDARFYEHGGIDFAALREAMQYNLSKRTFTYGASTISQQTVKNMWLSPSRTPLRKWHELWLTLALERRLDKDRILEIYLNVAEFGRGIYGAHAAARHYFGKSAANLSRSEATALAASLSSPVNHNPVTRTRYYERQRRKINRNMKWAG